MSNLNLSPRKSSEATIENNRKSVDKHIRELMHEMEYEDTLVQATPRGRVERVLTIYRGTRPLILVLTVLPLIPSNWRVAIVMLEQALASLSVASRDFTPDFMAGNERRTS